MDDTKALKETESAQQIRHPVEEDDAVDLEGSLVCAACCDVSVKIAAEKKNVNDILRHDIKRKIKYKLSLSNRNHMLSLSKRLTDSALLGSRCMGQAHRSTSRCRT